MIDPALTVASTVLRHSACASVFHRHRIDYCCKGGRSIEAAALERGIEVAGLVAELEAAAADRRDPAADPATMSTVSLIAHIVATHHDYLRKALPFVRGLSAKVARVHGDHNPRLRELETIVARLAETLEPHLDAEEQSLFPALMRKAVDPTAVAAELATMREDHLVVGGQLEQMRDATEDYTLPDWACTSYRTLFAELARLEDDVLRHVHLENHALMPRFVVG